MMTDKPFSPLLWKKYPIFLLLIFYNQPVYKQLALGWQIAKQLSGLNPLLLSNNKNYKLKKSGVLPFQ